MFVAQCDTAVTSAGLFGISVLRASRCPQEDLSDIAVRITRSPESERNARRRASFPRRPHSQDPRYTGS